MQSLFLTHHRFLTHALIGTIDRDADKRAEFIHPSIFQNAETPAANTSLRFKYTFLTADLHLSYLLIVDFR